MMENENTDQTPGADNEEQKAGNPQLPPIPPPAGDKKRMSDAKVFGLNFLIFIGYTLLCLATGGGGFILDGFLLLCHLITCLILAGVYNRWAWGVAGLAVFLVGVSVCASGGLGSFN